VRSTSSPSPAYHNIIGSRQKREEGNEIEEVFETENEI
jgi:hypothetical protein